MSSISLSDTNTCHGSAVAIAGRGVLILGRSGAGKSQLALDLISRGAFLVADDGVHCGRPPETGKVELTSPYSIQGMIEMRGVGILRAPVVEFAPLHLVVDLDQTEHERLPPSREIELLGEHFPLIFGVEQGQLAAAIMLYAQYGRAK